MLIKRLITGIVLTIFVLLAIIYLPKIYFISLMTVIMLFAAWEWGYLLNLKSWLAHLSYVFCIMFCMLAAWFLPVHLVLWVSLIWWTIAFYFILNYPAKAHYWSKGPWGKACIGILVIVPAWLALNVIRVSVHGTVILIFMLFLIWSMDTGAYFGGMWFGRDKLIPNVSPKKTWQGLYGGIILTLVIAVIGCWILKIPASQWLKVFFLTVIIGFFAVIGDLLESMLKRQVGIKDLGSYLPGHGGLLDRIDSLMAVAPVFLFALLYLK